MATDDFVWAAGVSGGRGPDLTNSRGLIARIDPATDEIVERLPLEYFQTELPKRNAGALVSVDDMEVVGDELWVSEYHAGSTKKGPIDPETGTRDFVYRYWMTRFDLDSGDRIDTRPYEGSFSGIAVGDTGVWLGHNYTRPKRFGDLFTAFGSIVRVDPATGDIEEIVDPFGYQYSDALATGYGSVWVSWLVYDDPGNRADFGRNVLLRVDERTLETTTMDMPGTGSDGGQALVSAEGSMWMTTGDRNGGLLLEIDPEANRVVRRIRLGKAPSAMTSAEGSLWIADFAQNVVREVDPGTGGILRAIKVPSQPNGITMGHGAVWVHTYQDGLVARIDI